jgi:imidazolonepropionase-like amidohydrolase
VAAILTIQEISKRKMVEMKIKIKSLTALLLVGVTTFSLSINAEEKKSKILFKNISIFDGTSEKLITGKDVLVEDNLIKKIAPTIKAEGAEVIDGSGRTLMPGLIDSHVHFTAFTPFAGEARATVDPFLAGAVSAVRAEEMLMRGITSARDLGGPSYHLKKLIKEGVINGPRITGAGTVISQTSGHGDFRDYNAKHPVLSGQGPQHWYERYISLIADGEDEVRRAARETLRNQANFLKLYTSGGVTSEFDPLHMVQYSPAELRTAVEVANQWKTYVATHTFNDEGVKMSIDAGVKSIEHVPLISKKTAKLLKKKGIYVGITAGSVLNRSLEELKAAMSAASFKKMLYATESYKKALAYLAETDAKVAIGTDLVAPWAVTINAEKAYQLMEPKALKKYFSNIQILRGVTSTGGELMQLAGPNQPYNDGPLGVIKEGAYADIILVKGDPLKDIMVITDDNNFGIIMKDGKIYKNTL